MRLELLLSVLTVGGALSSPTANLEKRQLAGADTFSPPWYPTPPGGTLLSWARAYDKAHKLVSKMTLVEKVNITSGTGWQMGLCVGNTGAVPRLGFPSLCLQDGPLGIRFADKITAFPAGITIGSTFNKELMYLRGKAMGAEARGKGINVLLGPSLGGIGRHPLGGRNWEGFGVDAYLTGIGSAETIKGIQSERVIATAKHLVGNEQEHFRQSHDAISSNIDDRTLHEFYGWPFADSVHAGVGTVMCSYQRLNNSHACHNSKLLNGYLKDELGFQGFVHTDWLAAMSGVATALAGSDMMMPGDGLGWDDRIPLWGKELTIAVLNSSVPIERLDDMVTRIVATWYKLEQDDGRAPNFSSWTKNTTGRLYEGSHQPPLAVVNKHINVMGDHPKLARKIAIEGTVLLKNNGILPLAKKGKIGVYGEDAGPGLGPNVCVDRGCNTGTLGMGWGSGSVDYEYLVTPLDGITALTKGSNVKISSQVTNNTLVDEIKKSAAKQDVCLVFVNADSGEGYLNWNGVFGDRNEDSLQLNGDNLILAVAEVCKNTVVVIHTVGYVNMEKWVNHKNVKAIINANLPGMESGNAIAEVLFGVSEPSGRLAYTIAKKFEDFGPTAPVIYTKGDAPWPQADFTEGIYLDYKHFDRAGITPRFEFGFGLSYTKFSIRKIKAHRVGHKSKYLPPRPRGLRPPTYSKKLPAPESALFPEGFTRINRFLYPWIEDASDVVVGKYSYPDGYYKKQPLSAAGGGEGGHPALWDDIWHVSVRVKNTGKRAGAEVAQLYIEYKGVKEIDMPVRQLRGFEKVWLRPGEEKTVTFKVKRREVSYWNTEKQTWVVPDGKIIAAVGTSSRKIAERVELR